MRNILNCKTNSSKKCMKCQKGSLPIESFARGRQIQTPQQAVTTLLVSSSYCSADQSDPNHLTNNKGEEGKKTIVADEKIFHFHLPIHFILHFTSPQHLLCKAFLVFFHHKEPRGFFLMARGPSSIWPRFSHIQIPLFPRVFFSSVMNLQLLRLSSQEYSFLIYLPQKNTVKIILKALIKCYITRQLASMQILVHAVAVLIPEPLLFSVSLHHATVWQCRHTLRLIRNSCLHT